MNCHDKQLQTDLLYRGYLFFSVKDRNLFHQVDTIGNIFTSGADDTLTLAKILRFVFCTMENIVEKGENTGYQHYLHFHSHF